MRDERGPSGPANGVEAETEAPAESDDWTVKRARRGRLRSGSIHPRKKISRESARLKTPVSAII